MGRLGEVETPTMGANHAFLHMFLSFTPESFERKIFTPGTSRSRRLVADELGVAVFPTFHATEDRDTGDDVSNRARRQVGPLNFLFRPIFHFYFSTFKPASDTDTSELRTTFHSTVNRN